MVAARLAGLSLLVLLLACSFLPAAEHPPSRPMPAVVAPRAQLAPPVAEPEPVESVALLDEPAADTVGEYVDVPPSPPREPAHTSVPITVSTPLNGTLLDDYFESPIIGRELTYRVYLPPDYDEQPGRRYSVLYMLHGAGGNYTEWSDTFLPERTDELISAGEIEPMIVVMPDSSGQTYWANWIGGPQWSDYITYDVVPEIDRRYRTLRRPSARAIGGHSMGGYGALHIGLRHPDVFGTIGAHSPSVRVDPDPSFWFLPDEAFFEHSPLWLVQNRGVAERQSIWMDSGTDDWWLENIEIFREALVEATPSVQWHMFPGTHEADYWIERAPDYLRFYSQALRHQGAAARQVVPR